MLKYSHCSPRTYKRQLAKWGFVKNISVKENAVPIVLHGATQSPSSNSDGDTVVLSTGKVISYDRLVTHLRRKGLGHYVAPQDLRRSLALVSSPNQKASPLPMSIAPPEIILTSEAVLHGTYGYMTTTFLPPPVVPDLTTAPTDTANKNPDLIGPVDPIWRDLSHTISNARRSLEANRLGDAISHLKAAPEQLRIVMTTHPRRTLSLFYLLILSLMGKGVSATVSQQVANAVKALVRYTDAVCSETAPAADSFGLDPEQRDLRRVIRGLAQLSQAEDGDILYETVLRAWVCMSDYRNRAMGFPDWRQQAGLGLDIVEQAGRFEERTTLVVDEDALRCLYEGTLLAFGPESDKTLSLSYALALFEEQKRPSGHSRETLEQMLGRMRAVASPPP